MGKQREKIYVIELVQTGTENKEIFITHAKNTTSAQKKAVIKDGWHVERDWVSKPITNMDETFDKLISGFDIEYQTPQDRLGTGRYSNAHFDIISVEAEQNLSIDPSIELTEEGFNKEDTDFLNKPITRKQASLLLQGAINQNNAQHVFPTIQKLQDNMIEYIDAQFKSFRRAHDTAISAMYGILVAKGVTTYPELQDFFIEWDKKQQLLKQKEKEEEQKDNEDKEIPGVAK